MLLNVILASNLLLNSFSVNVSKHKLHYNYIQLTLNQNQFYKINFGHIEPNKHTSPMLLNSHISNDILIAITVVNRNNTSLIFYDCIRSPPLGAPSYILFPSESSQVSDFLYFLCNKIKFAVYSTFLSNFSFEFHLTNGWHLVKLNVAMAK